MIDDSDSRQKKIEFIGESDVIQEIKKLINQVAPTNSPVLIIGESGTGKEVAAKYIHALSKRTHGSFVAVNCAAIPHELIESELFGHEKGAFTGAHTTRIGRFESASGGTLFLDEVGEMPIEMQAKLLRVLQERSFERVGGNNSISSDVRIIAATNKRLEQAIELGTFREDLYYRLNVFPIHLPDLAKRTQDIPDLITAFIKEDHTIRFHPKTLKALMKYPWPGNIRELQNLTERMSILYPDQEITLDKLPRLYRMGDEQKTQCFNQTVLETQIPNFNKNFNLKHYLQTLEAVFIHKALEEANGVVAHAATRLGLRRTTLVEKMRKHQIDKKYSE